MFLLGCSSGAESGEYHESDPASSESTATATEGLTTVTRSSTVDRAEEWVAAKLKYCQAPNGGHDYDTACSSTCARESNPDWDPYRSDCSGLISWAWELPAPGRVTGEFAPFDTAVSTTIKCTDMKPGDAANLKAGGHIVLFKNWITPGTKALFIEEPGCGVSMPYAREFTSNVTCSGSDVQIAYEGETFVAIRYGHIADDTEATDAGAPTTTDAGVATGGKSDGGVKDPPVASSADGGVQEPAASPAADMADSGGCSLGAGPLRTSSGAAFLMALVACAAGRRRRRAR
ncbi:MAG: hypothetical protein ABI551_11720 [Polyangiaceae bacterium]